MSIEKEYDRAHVIHQMVREARHRWGARFGVHIDSREIASFFFKLEGYTQPHVEGMRELMGQKPPPPPPQPPEPVVDDPVSRHTDPYGGDDPWSR